MKQKQNRQSQLQREHKKKMNKPGTAILFGLSIVLAIFCAFYAFVLVASMGFTMTAVVDQNTAILDRTVRYSKTTRSTPLPGAVSNGGMVVANNLNIDNGGRAWQSETEGTTYVYTVDGEIYSCRIYSLQLYYKPARLDVLRNVYYSSAFPGLSVVYRGTFDELLWSLATLSFGLVPILYFLIRYGLLQKNRPIARNN